MKTWAIRLQFVQKACIAGVFLWFVRFLKPLSSTTPEHNYIGDYWLPKEIPKFPTIFCLCWKSLESVIQIKVNLVRNATTDVCNHENASYPYKLFFIKNFLSRKSSFSEQESRRRAFRKDSQNSLRFPLLLFLIKLSQRLL